MSDTREASWYEIALTHSQIVKIFVGLLVCLVGAFFSGLWIGRDAVNAVENVPSLTVATAPAGQGAPGTGQAEDSEGEGERKVDQLHFFSEDDVVPTAAPAGGPQESAAEPAIAQGGPDTTLVDDVRSSASAPIEIASNEPDAPVEVTREPQGEAAAAQTSGDLVVQVFSSNDATQARRVLGRLAEGGHPAYLSPVEVQGRTMYRVRIGPYSERERAEQVADNVRRTFKLDTWITQKST
jgi:cell division septation protein DedD